jgi:hypothetical protein
MGMCVRVCVCMRRCAAIKTTRATNKRHASIESQPITKKQKKTKSGQLTTLGAEKAAMEADPLFKEYMKKITDKGFFKGLEEGSKGPSVGRGCMWLGGWVFGVFDVCVGGVGGVLGRRGPTPCDTWEEGSKPITDATDHPDKFNTIIHD